jgi:hypothetical protein
MAYVTSSRWSLLERFEITDGVGTPQFEARGHLGSLITGHDTSGREVADIRKHLMTDTHEVYVGGQRAAQAIEASHEERRRQPGAGGGLGIGGMVARDIR